ncbi:MAG: DUF2383 domain-containing protein, partial [Fibrobacter sp.]|nr:DUF2383 domain-containing protein [Fibrobacter sp.]
MEMDELIHKLKSLQKIDHDAMQSYDKILEKVQDNEIRHHIFQFREDHKRHIYSISDLLRTMSEEPSSYFPDFMGTFLKEITAIEGNMGTEHQLKALERGERMTNDEYSKADLWFVDPKIHELLSANYQDERRHIT